MLDEVAVDLRSDRADRFADQNLEAGVALLRRSAGAERVRSEPAMPAAAVPMNARRVR
jgi:hypothetical protein